MLFLLFFSLFSCFTPTFSFILDPLSLFNGGDLRTYAVGKTSKIYVISIDSIQNIENLKLKTQNGGESINGTFFLYPTLTGSLTPFIPSQDGDSLTVRQTGSRNITGWLYITKEENYNIYPMDINSQKINFQPGTNVFFPMETNSGLSIPVAENVIILDTVSLTGFQGVPEANGKMFFDSDSIQNQLKYDQMQLTMSIFHFKTNGIDVKYEISYGFPNTLSINSAGVLMTDQFPTFFGNRAEGDYFDNSNNDNITFDMMCRFDNTQNYTVIITLQDSDNTTHPKMFPLISTWDTKIEWISPLSEMKISSNGPYACQFRFKNENPTETTVLTTSTVVTTTQSSGSFNLILCFIWMVFVTLL